MQHHKVPSDKPNELKTGIAHRRALKKLSAFFDNPPASGSALEAEFEVLMTAMARYEDKYFTVKAPKPLAA
jgi:antitoxin component HigA of HigAB toxin-antitoxin module